MERIRTRINVVQVLLFCGLALMFIAKPGSTSDATPGSWKTHKIYQLNGSSPALRLPSNYQITESWNCIAAMPYIVYMPEKNRVYMEFWANIPHISKTMYSDDWGATWSAPRDASTGIALTYLGDGKLAAIEGGLFKGNDYGETWESPIFLPPASNGRPWISWDPMLVDRDRNGKVTRLMSFCTDNMEPGLDWHLAHFQGYIRFSTDEGQTWSQDIKVPEMYGVNETAFVRARNGDIIAACRTDNPERFKYEEDHYGGLGVSISKDNGYTWSKLNMLYEWGRHHPCMVTMPNGDILMTYVVRRGYPDTPNGYPQFGIEAVVSHDNGKTWDLDHKYILASWAGNLKGGYENSSQSTSTVLLPNGSLLTAFGTGYRAHADAQGNLAPRDIGIINWRLNNGKLNEANTIASAPFSSDKRNKFDLNTFFGVKATVKERNVATKAMGAQITSSHGYGNPDMLLYDPYYYRSIFNMDTTPSWLEITWPKSHIIDEIVIYPGQLSTSVPSTELVPLDYRLQYKVGSEWRDLLPEVKDAQRLVDFVNAHPDENMADFKYVHRFPPVSVKAIRLYITRTNDSGKRMSSPDKVIVPPEKREVMLRKIEVYESAQK